MLSGLDRLRLLARAFTRPVFAQMARARDWREPLGFLLEQRIAITGRGLGRPLAVLFEEAWDRLADAYRNEYIYKNHLASRIVFGRHSPNTTSLHLELPIGRSIVDVAVANGTSTAYEIKTEYDSPRRLITQTRDYLRVFDRVYVVAHAKHTDELEQVIDQKVGIILMGRNGTMSTRRPAASNLANIDSVATFRCLRRSEYLAGIQETFGETPTLPNGLLASRCERLFAQIPPEEAHRIFVNALRARTTDEKSVAFVSKLPPSLRALGYGTPLSTPQRQAVLSLLLAPAPLRLCI